VHAHSLSHFFGRFLPDLDNAFVLFLLGQKAAPKIALHLFHIQQGLLNNRCFFRWNGDIRHGEGGTRAGSIFKTNILDLISGFGGSILARNIVQVSDEIADAAFFKRHVAELHLFRQNIVENCPANSGGDDTCFWGWQTGTLIVVVGLSAQFNMGMNIQLPEFISHDHFFNIAKHAAFFDLGMFIIHGQVIHA